VPACLDGRCSSATYDDVAEGSNYDEDFLSLPPSHLATGQPAPRNDSMTASNTFPQTPPATQDAIRERHIPIADRDPTSSAAALRNAHRIVQKSLPIKKQRGKPVRIDQKSNLEMLIREPKVRFPAR
jgi:hypothetical protein